MNDRGNGGDDTVVTLDGKPVGEGTPPALPVLVADTVKETTQLLRKKYARQLRMQALQLEQWCENAEQQIGDNRSTIAELRRVAVILENS